jgi:hypothetical protein
MSAVSMEMVAGNGPLRHVFRKTLTKGEQARTHSHMPAHARAQQMHLARDATRQKQLGQRARGVRVGFGRRSSVCLRTQKGRWAVAWGGGGGGG